LRAFDQTKLFDAAMILLYSVATISILINKKRAEKGQSRFGSLFVFALNC